MGNEREQVLAWRPDLRCLCQASFGEISKFHCVFLDTGRFDGRIGSDRMVVRAYTENVGSDRQVPPIEEETALIGLVWQRFAKSVWRSLARWLTAVRFERTRNYCSICLTLALFERPSAERVQTMNGCRSASLAGSSKEIAMTAVDAESGRQWFAVYTIPQNEKSVARHLELREIESFLPTYPAVRVWKNRQRVNLRLPLFPSYLFVRLGCGERARVLQSPGVLRIVGNSREPLPVPNSIIEFLRSGASEGKIEPYTDLIVGQRVRIKRGAMQGMQGVLVRRNNILRFVLSVELINHHAAVELRAEDLEPVMT